LLTSIFNVGGWQPHRFSSRHKITFSSPSFRSGCLSVVKVAPTFAYLSIDLIESIDQTDLIYKILIDMN